VSKIEQIAKKYFDAFHNGRIDEVMSYFAPGSTVRYGSERERDAAEFFAETKDMIAQFRFTTHGYYTSPETKNVLIHFAHSVGDPSDDAPDVEAVDIIAFDDADRIRSIKVIPRV
jgi:hypothetical protein